MGRSIDAECDRDNPLVRPERFETLARSVFAAQGHGSRRQRDGTAVARRRDRRPPIGDRDRPHQHVGFVRELQSLGTDFSAFCQPQRTDGQAFGISLGRYEQERVFGDRHRTTRHPLLLAQPQSLLSSGRASRAGQVFFIRLKSQKPAAGSGQHHLAADRNGQGGQQQIVSFEFDRAQPAIADAGKFAGNQTLHPPALGDEQQISIDRIGHEVDDRAVVASAGRQQSDRRRASSRRTFCDRHVASGEGIGFAGGSKNQEMGRGARCDREGRCVLPFRVAGLTLAFDFFRGFLRGGQQARVAFVGEFEQHRFVGQIEGGRRFYGRDRPLAGFGNCLRPHNSGATGIAEPFF